jgi:flavodoxin
MVERRTAKPKALLVCHSEHHGNTHRVAEAMGVVLGAEVVDPHDVDVDELSGYDLVGFGSGIYFGVVHRELIAMVDQLPPGDGAAVFTFSTSGSFLLPWLGTSHLRNRLTDRGYQVLDDFNCRGWDTVGPLRFIGGVNRGSPSARDLSRAGQFARDVQRRVTKKTKAGT